MTDRAGSSAREGAARAIERRALRPELNPWTYLTPEADLRARAAAIDGGSDQGRQGPLRGRTFAVKDNIDVAGVPTTAGCRAFSYVPETSSPIVERMLDAGALFVGKTNLDQFATGLVGTRSPDFGICRNPWDPDFIAGGSSSGSAIAVATGMVDLALGTDTAGSGRVPAACCGIVGLKPTRGRISTGGVVPASRQFDCVSLFTTTIADAATVLSVRTPGRGSTGQGESPPTPVPSRVRVGVPNRLEWFGDPDGPACFEAAVAMLGAGGAELVPMDLSPFLEAGRLLYGSALVADRAAAFGAFAAANPTEMDPTVLAIVTGASRHPATDAFDALEELARIRVRTSPTWREVDVVVTPTIARHPRVDEVLTDPFGPNAELGTYTSFVNLLDLCAIAVPVGSRSGGLPFGISLVAPAHGEHLLLAVAAALLAEPPPPVDRRVRLAVVGAHLSGQPLNHQLLAVGARLAAATTTAATYRLYDLGTEPARPGMIRVREGGAEIAVEVWELDPAGLGTFVSGVPAPLVTGSVELADGSTVLGFLCEPHATSDARDITRFGGWVSYRTARASS